MFSQEITTDIDEKDKKVLFSYGLDFSISLNEEMFSLHKHSLFKTQSVEIAPSIKTNLYFSATYLKGVYTEVFFSQDFLKVEKEHNAFNSTGVLFGANRVFLNKNSFTAAIGAYYSFVNKQLNSNYMQSYKIGLVSKFKFGIYIGNGISTGVYWKYFLDLAKNEKFTNEILLHQNIFGFNMEVDFDEVLKLFKKKSKEKEYY